MRITGKRFRAALVTLPAAMLFALLTLNAHAATTLEVGIPGPEATTQVDTLAQYIYYVYLFVLGAVGIAALVSLVVWGVVWTASGIADKKARALEGIKSTLLGLALPFVAFLLFSLINQDLTLIKTPTLPAVGEVKNEDSSPSQIISACPYAGQRMSPISELGVSCAHGGLVDGADHPAADFSCYWVGQPAGCIEGAGAGYMEVAGACQPNPISDPHCTWRCCRKYVPTTSQSSSASSSSSSLPLS